MIIAWNFFVKIIAAPLDAYKDGGFWFSVDGTEIGEVIWGELSIIQQVDNNEYDGLHGQQYISPDHAGFGGWS